MGCREGPLLESTLSALGEPGTALSPDVDGVFGVPGLEVGRHGGVGLDHGMANGAFLRPVLLVPVPDLLPSGGMVRGDGIWEDWVEVGLNAMLALQVLGEGGGYWCFYFFQS